MEIKPYLLWVLGTLTKQSLVLGSESTLQVVVSDVVKLRGVLSGPYLSVYSNGKCSACISGLLKEQILSLPALKKFKAFLEGEKAKVRESKVEGEERRSFSLQGQSTHSVEAQSWLSHLIFIHAHIHI